MIEKIFEKILWNSRIITILPVIFGLIGAIICFVIASYDIVKVLVGAWQYFAIGNKALDLHSDAVGAIVGAIDLYLMALVLFIFSFGIYELFISEIEPMKLSKHSKVLEVKSLDQLKDKIGKVIVMVLIVNFFQRVLHTKFETPLEMCYLALSILGLCVGLYFLHKGSNH
ncbi:YqhA family protein [Campylobacter sp. FMV-PI01]|uniref:YqhA family protein n=1 Tax=Campylobacter portucalensis TaxID=2608384 RepID=A0A6L5WFH4_9BACT|nr:YqhA family protein [Campylobacter portucalensis]MSN95780.1 YqhA family protein [Campylobacter portucalensis]